MGKQSNILTDGKKRRLRNYIISGARNYNKYLVGKIFKIVCDDGTTVDVRFYISDFQHLSGLYTNLDNADFYYECLKGTISIGNINTFQKYDWSTLKTKCRFIENIHELLYKDGQKVLLTEFLDTHTFVFPYAVKNLGSNMCVGFVDNINKARSLRKASTSLNFGSQKNIIAIFARNVTHAKYHELIYVSDVLEIYQKDEALIEVLEEPMQVKFLEIITRPDR